MTDGCVMDDNFFKDMEEIGRDIAGHQIETFGRELTDEEQDQVFDELFEESKRKYEGMAIEEAAMAQTFTMKKLEAEMTAIFGPELYKGFNYLDENSDESKHFEGKDAINA